LRRGGRGQSVLYVVVLMPVLLLVLAISLQVALLQLDALRLRSAVDLASVGGAAVVDAGYYGRTGRLRLDPRGAAVAARAILARNLSGVAAGRDATLSAEIAVLNDVPARDPYSGAQLDRPAVCIRARLPVAAGLLRLAGAPAWISLTRTADAELRR
jgi:hypothetical protein